MNWIPLTEEQQLARIVEQSFSIPQVIFKHSTRCAISSMAKGRLDREKTPEGIPFYYLDLIKYRSVSNQVSQQFQVPHQSPQVLIISNGKSVYSESHNGIDMGEILGNVTSTQGS